MSTILNKIGPSSNPILINSLNCPSSCKYVDNYLVVLVKISNKEFTAVIDTGAQATVIKQSSVPIGTPIMDSNLLIKGVRGPPIKVCGIANIHMVIGNQAFTVKCVVINDNDIDFPAGASIIVGVDLLAMNQLDLSTSRWALTNQNDVVKNLEPAIISGSLFTAPQIDYLQHVSDYEVDESDEVYSVDQNNNVVIPDTCSAVHNAINGSNNYSNTSYTDDVTGRRTRNNPYKFFPEESLMQENYEVPKLGQAKQTVPQLQQQPDCLDTKLSTDAMYSIITEANVSLEPSSMNMIKVSVQYRLGLPAPKGVRYLFEVEYSNQK